MNVTNIGTPFAAPASQGGAADAAAATGFAGLLGILGGDGQGQLAFGATGTASQLGTQLLGTQTNAPLMPTTTDPTATLPGDKPQVAMAQLLATAAPGAVSTPVATGGNPLADAIAKALANAQGKTEPGTGEAATTEAATDASATPATDALPTPPVAPTPPKLDGSAVQPKPGDGKIAAPKPDATDPAAVALDAEAPVASEVPELPRPAVPAKVSAKSPRDSAAKEDSIDPAGAPLPAPETATTAAALVQPVAVPVAQPQQPSQAATPQPAARGKSDGVLAPRSAKVEAAAGKETTPQQTTNEKMADIASAIGTHGQGGAAEGSSGRDGSGQHAFGQQLAAVDAQGAGALSAAGATTPLAATSASTASAATTADPVINARPGELGRSLGVEIARKVDAGEDTLRVRLNPAELGRVEVTLAFDDKGRVQATMRAESQQTLDLLRQDAPDLGRALDQAGIRSDASSFRFESRDSGTGSGTNGQPAFQQQSRGGNQQFRDESETQTAAFQPIRGDGQVDLIA